MKAEEERERELEQGDPEIRYLSEAKEKYAVPGFVHKVPEPKAVIYLTVTYKSIKRLFIFIKYI
jgi:hypothetical protein